MNEFDESACLPACSVRSRPPRFCWNNGTTHTYYTYKRKPLGPGWGTGTHAACGLPLESEM